MSSTEIIEKCLGRYGRFVAWVVYVSSVLGRVLVVSNYIIVEIDGELVNIIFRRETTRANHRNKIKTPFSLKKLSTTPFEPFIASRDPIIYIPIDSYLRFKFPETVEVFQQTYAYPERFNMSYVSWNMTETRKNGIWLKTSLFRKIKARDFQKLIYQRRSIDYLQCAIIKEKLPIPQIAFKLILYYWMKQK